MYPYPPPTPTPISILGIISVPESTANLLVSGVMGAIGALFITPVNAIIANILKFKENKNVNISLI